MGFIKWTNLSGLELSFYRSFFAVLTVAFFTRREGLGLNRISAAASLLYAALLILFVAATKKTTAANAIFLQYTAPVYLLILEPLIYKERFRIRDLLTVVICLGGMVLFFVGKLRPKWALVGGAIIITAVVVHMLVDARQKRMIGQEQVAGGL